MMTQLARFTPAVAALLILGAATGARAQDNEAAPLQARPDIEARTNTRSDGNAPRERVRAANVRTNGINGVPPVEPLGSGNTMRRPEGVSGEPDVFLDVTDLSVEEITLEVKNLKAHLALDARVASLVTLTAGVDASIEDVKLTIKGVKAKAQLRVHLDNVAYILDRTLTTIDRNPQMIDRLLQSVDNTVGTVGGVANTALKPGGVLSQTVNALGQTVQSTLDTTGNIVEKTLDTTGKTLGSRTIGRLIDLPILKQTTNAAGQVVRQVKDTKGNLIEYTLDNAGRVASSRVLEQAAGAANAAASTAGSAATNATR